MHSFCHYCGQKYSELTWPRHCNYCSNSTWQNPLPVVVMIVPVITKLRTKSILAVRRNIDPDIGKLAMPSGYVDNMEDWRDAAIRELEEETGISHIKQDELKLFDVVQSKNKKHMLVFCVTPSITEPFPQVSNDEVQELVVACSDDLVWETHRIMARNYYG